MCAKKRMLCADQSGIGAKSLGVQEGPNLNPLTKDFDC